MPNPVSIVPPPTTMATDPVHTTEHSSSEAEFWLYEYQKTITNVRGLISRGQSESATRLIDEQIARWQAGCQSWLQCDIERAQVRLKEWGVHP